MTLPKRLKTKEDLREIEQYLSAVLVSLEMGYIADEHIDFVYAKVEEGLGKLRQIIDKWVE